MNLSEATVTLVVNVGTRVRPAGPGQRLGESSTRRTAAWAAATGGFSDAPGTPGGCGSCPVGGLRKRPLPQLRRVHVAGRPADRCPQANRGLRMTPSHGVALRCVECGREQPAGERGWNAYLTTGEDKPAEAVVYCPGCSEREFGVQPPRRRRLHRTDFELVRADDS